jgi:hypothetical protein
MISGTTCVINPASGWTQVDVSSDLSGSLDIGPLASRAGDCKNLTFFGNLDTDEEISVTSLTGISEPFYEMQLIFWVMLIDDWDKDTTVQTTLEVNNDQKKSPRSKTEKTS